MSNDYDENLPNKTNEPEIITEENNSPSIDNELRAFIADIASLSDTLPLTTNAMNDALIKTAKQLKEFEKENIIHHEIDGKKILLVKADCIQQFEILRKRYKIFGLSFKTIPRSYIMALISQYDAFLGKLIKAIFLIKPELLNASEKILTFAQLVEFGSLNNAKEFIIEKEIESVLRKSHPEQFQWLENKFGLPLKEGLDVWPVFIELTERRNLFVHTDGIVSSQYMKVCKENNVPLIDINVGDELYVSKEYFERAYNAIFEVGFKLAHVLWRKFMPDELGGADQNLIDIGYETLYEEKYELTKMIFDFATLTLKKHCKEESRRIMVVNRALAYKWQNDNSKAKEIISKEDWSAAKVKFRLAEAVILENYSEAYEIMRIIGKNHSEVAIKEYRDWPLFKAIKNEIEFQNVFEEIFGEPYNKVEKEDLDLPPVSSDLARAKVSDKTENINCREPAVQPPTES
jgi:hypothetical protein